MVAVIKTGHSINRIVNYNENKVKEGVANCISAANYPFDADQLSVSQKLNRLVKQAALNENVSRNSVHVSLNFDASERLSKERLQQIADSYMQQNNDGQNTPIAVSFFLPHLNFKQNNNRPDITKTFIYSDEQFVCSPKPYCIFNYVTFYYFVFNSPGNPTDNGGTFSASLDSSFLFDVVLLSPYQ